MTLIYEPLEDAAILVDAAVAEERPPAAHLLGALQVNLNDLLALLLVIGAEEELTLRTCHEA